VEKNDKLKQYQSLAIQLRQVVPSIQAAFLSTLNVQNVLSVDVKKQRIQILNHCFHIQFYIPTEQAELCVPQFIYQGHYAEALEEFCLHDIVFLVGDQSPQHSLYLRNKVKQLRQLILQQVFVLFDGPSRVQTILTEIRQTQSELFQQRQIQSPMPVLKKPFR
jgi:hypothetical protein